MAKQHDRALTIKDRLLDESGSDPGQYGEAINNLADKNPGYKRAMAEAQARLKHLISELEVVLDAEQKKIRPFASMTSCAPPHENERSDSGTARRGLPERHRIRPSRDLAVARLPRRSNSSHSPQFQIENPFGEGLLRLDYLIHHGDVPLVTIEGEPTDRQFDTGFKQAKHYSRNFKPRQRGHPMQERTVPFLLTAAGSRAEMCRAVVRGLNVEYESIRKNGLPAFLEWNELLAEAGQLEPAAVVSPQQQVLVADLAHQFFTDLFGSIDQVAGLRKKDDQKIILFNRIIDHARHDGEAGLRAACRQLGRGTHAAGRVLKTIAWYRRKIESHECTGAAVARGYRTFLLQPGGRGAHRYFTGESQSRAYRVRGVVRYRNVARYFTPTEIAQQMMRLARPPRARAGD